MMKKESVISLIEKAFADLPHPGDTLLHSSCQDDTDIRPFYGIQDWREASSQMIEREDAALCFFSPAAFRYFLPAYLIWTLNNYDTSESPTVNSTIYSLDPTSARADLQPFMRSKYSLLSQAQRHAVIAFLEHMSARPDHCDARAAESALTGFWRNK